MIDICGGSVDRHRVKAVVNISYFAVSSDHVGRHGLNLRIELRAVRPEAVQERAANQFEAKTTSTQ